MNETNSGLLGPSATKVLARGLSAPVQRWLRAEAERIQNEREDRSSQPRSETEKREIRDVFAEAENRLKTTWTVNMIMSIVVYALLIGVAILAFTMTILTRGAWWGILFGGTTVASFFGHLIWKPQEKALAVTQDIQRLALILAGLEMQWIACQKLEEPSDCICEANEAALKEMKEL